jgi:hypothetical protein
MSFDSYTYYTSLSSLQISGEFPMDCPLHDSLLRVHYKGILLDEPKSVFYDTRADNDGEPLEFCSGEGLVNISTLICHINAMILLNESFVVNFFSKSVGELHIIYMKKKV